jgi:hypothetical protein
MIAKTPSLRAIARAGSRPDDGASSGEDAGVMRVGCCSLSGPAPCLLSLPMRITLPRSGDVARPPRGHGCGESSCAIRRRIVPVSQNEASRARHRLDAARGFSRVRARCGPTGGSTLRQLPRARASPGGDTSCPVAAAWWMTGSTRPGRQAPRSRAEPAGRPYAGLSAAAPISPSARVGSPAKKV